MHRSIDCPHCHHHAHLVAPAAWTRVFVGFAWVVAGAMVFMAGMIGPFIMLVLPFLGVCAGGLVAGAHTLAAEPPTCGHCGRIVAGATERAAARAGDGVPERVRLAA